ncbi:MAG: hypothetical protein QN183_01745 [Armatimonadota bacterium]|nr:hypothetical protein [Armatimonadota bacterium]MDR7486671.1 hypothetical protein [Armatimonadota bacterium]MDR7534675.1 hypothetical protein [Armatimonadota bacterium]MDR7535076.1 hypothetical protein [Armatimonadota bacterium]
MARTRVLLLVTVVAGVVGVLAYTAGLAAGRTAAAAAGGARPLVQPAQILEPIVPAPGQVPQPFPNQITPGTPGAPGRAPNLREFVPLPFPGQQTPGQLPGTQQGECEPIILFYHNGQLYQLRPGPGPQDGPGRPTSPPEYFRLDPYQGPAIPGLPFPQPDRGPGFSPVNPRS